jgi:undecaprenyl-diphosphatase
MHMSNPVKSSRLLAGPAEFRMLQYAFISVAAMWLAFWVVSICLDVSVARLDRQTILAVRDPSNPARMRGPQALEEATRDFTALGGQAVLGMIVVAFAVILVLHPSIGSVWFFILACVPGYVAGMTLKNLFDRARPSIVPHLSHVGSRSFPSLHSMMSAITFVTIGVMLAQCVDNRSLRRLLITMPLCLTLLVGISRVCMGVHYPTDVLGGWSAGLAWTWIVFRVHSWQIARQAVG